MTRAYGRAMARSVDVSGNPHPPLMTNIELYESPDGRISLDVRTDKETVWLTQQQLAQLFGRDVTVIRRHIANARREELAGIPTSARLALVQIEGDRRVERQVEHYNLDMVISVGYRVKSSDGVQFRRWAADVLRRYVIEGSAINDRRLAEIGKIVTVLSRSGDEVIAGVADVLADYLPGLTLLRDYDEGQLDAAPVAVPGWTLTLDEARAVIARAAAQFPRDALFGRERGDALAGIVETIYQGFGGQSLYPTVEEQAANLLYLIIKDHPLSDGNKRSAAALFVTFLARNGLLREVGGRARVTNNALAATTLMVAMSDPSEKDLMVALLIRMLTEDAE